MLRLYFLPLIFAFYSCAPEYKYTPEEKSYISANTITWCVRSTSYPYESLKDDGTIIGSSADYIALISEKTGIKIEIAHKGTMTECQQLLKDGRVQMMAAVKPTPEGSKYSTFTRPYIYVDTVMLKMKNNPKSVGIGRGYAVKNYLLNDRKDLLIAEYTDDEVSVRAMLRGEVDSVIMDVESANLLTKKYRLETDRTTIPFEYPLSFSFRTQDTIVRQIFDKAISDITDAEHARIRRKWM